MAYTSTTDRQAIAERLQSVDGPVWLFTHAKPDGDAMGSLLALHGALKALGKTATGVLVPPVPAYAAALPGLADLHVDDGTLTLPDEPALVVVCDTGAVKQLGSAERLITPWLDRTLVIDHHLSGDLAVADFLIDSAQASCAEIVADVLDAMALPLIPEQTTAINTALYAGLATDTGWFRFSNTTPNTLRRAAALIESGVDHAALFEAIEQQQPPEKLALAARALNSLRWAAGGRAVVMALTTADFAETGAAIEHTEGLVNLPLTVGTVQAAALITERTGDDGQTVSRISFRSKPHPVPIKALDVAALANTFGGGGHARAAGGGYEGPAPEATQAVLDAFDQALPHGLA